MDIKYLDYSPEYLVDIINKLKGKVNLKKLVCGVKFGEWSVYQDALNALCDLLINPSCKVEELDIPCAYSEQLVDAVEKNHSLKVFNIKYQESNPSIELSHRFNKALERNKLLAVGVQEDALESDNGESCGTYCR